MNTAAPYARSAARAVLVATLLMACAVVHAACPLRDYVIAGMVVDPSGDPLGGVMVTTTWEERNAGSLSNERETGADGRFEVRVAFDTYSGRTLTGRDRCEAALEEITLIFRRSGYRVRQLNLDPDNVESPLLVQLVGDR
jgi:hypothetical protein